MKETKFVAWPDTHAPSHDPKAVACALNILKWYRPDEVVILGDFLDIEATNHWNRKQLKTREGLRLQHEFDAGNLILDQIQKHTKKVTYLLGNHEDRLFHLIDEQPELEGIVDLDKGLRLRERGIKVLPYNVPYRLGKLSFVHGLFTGGSHAKKHVEAYGGSIVYGHLHDVMIHTRVSPFDVNDKHIGMCVGCLAKRNPQYMRNRPDNWVHCLCTGLVRSDGTFDATPTIISNGVASLAGRTFRA